MKKKIITSILLLTSVCLFAAGCGKNKDSVISKDGVIGEFSEWNSDNQPAESDHTLSTSNVKSVLVSADGKTETLETFAAQPAITVGDISTSIYSLSDIDTVEESSDIQIIANMDTSIMSYAGSVPAMIKINDGSYASVDNVNGHAGIVFNSKENSYIFDEENISDIIFNFGDDTTVIEHIEISLENGEMHIKSDYTNAIEAIVTFSEDGVAETFLMTIGLTDGEFTASAKEIHETYVDALK